MPIKLNRVSVAATTFANPREACTLYTLGNETNFQSVSASVFET